MKAIDMKTSGSLTRRQTMQYLAGIGAAIAAPRGDHLIAHAEARRSTPAAERRDERPRRRERHPRQPRISVRFDSLSSALHIDGERFAENARVNITIDSGSPHLDYSLPWSVASTRTVAVANNHGKLNETVHISPLGCIFTGRVEVVDRETGLRTTEDFRGSLC
ncbi:MAG: hypothetical protein U0031_15145 [Thermomicrobiales bacterium]